MRPESKPKAQGKPSKESYLALGIPKVWVEPLQALEYATVKKIKALEKPGKLHLEMMG